MLGYGRDYGIPVVLLALLGCIVALVVHAVRQLAKRPVVIPRNPLGDAETVAVPVAGGGYTFLDPDLPPGPAITVLADGTVHAPQLRGPGQEERTKARDQLTDMTTRPRLGSGHKGNGVGTPAVPLAPPPRPPAPGLRRVAILRRLDQAETAGMLPPGVVATLQADWEVE